MCIKDSLPLPACWFLCNFFRSMYKYSCKAQTQNQFPEKTNHLATQAAQKEKTNLLQVWVILSPKNA